MKNQVLELKKLVVSVAVIAFSLSGLVGCLEEDNRSESTTTFDVGAIVKDQNLPNEMKAEKIALIGEQLFTPSGFMFSEELMNLALSFDKNNSRAQLYKEMNGPMMQLRGAMTRMRPLQSQFSPGVQESYRDGLRLVAQNPVIEKFFTSGPADLQNEVQAQALVSNVLRAQDHLRLYLKSHKQLSLELYTPYAKGRLSDVWYFCPVRAFGRAEGYHLAYTIKNCKLVKATRYTIDAGDIELLQHMASGLEIASIVSTSYDATGYARYDKSLSTRWYDVEDRVELLQSLKRLGQLTSHSTLGMVHGLGSDFYSGAQWAQSFQRTLCPLGWEHENRPGRLFDKGVCVQDYPGRKRGQVDAAFRVTAMALAGQNVGVFTRKGKLDVTDLADDTDGAEYLTDANLLAPLVHPVRDLKSVLPTKFDKCRQANNLGDHSVAGFFPRRDGEAVTKSLGIIFDECK